MFVIPALYSDSVRGEESLKTFATVNAPQLACFKPFTTNEKHVFPSVEPQVERRKLVV